jgi:chemosensory pili system protein ChpA (sensor histidine kinase/response regulator)
MTAATMNDPNRLKNPLGHVPGLRRKQGISRYREGWMRESLIPDPAEEQRDTVKTVLLVEDNREVAKVLAYALAEEGYEVATAADGLQALDKLRWGLRPWCLLLDMRMPVMTGRELRQAMNNDPELRDIPVIGMTGGRWKPEDTLGFDALVEKPIDIGHMLELLKNVAIFRLRHLKSDREIHETS